MATVIFNPALCYLLGFFGSHYPKFFLLDTPYPRHSAVSEETIQRWQPFVSYLIFWLLVASTGGFDSPIIGIIWVATLIPAVTCDDFPLRGNSNTHLISNPNPTTRTLTLIRSLTPLSVLPTSS